MKKSILLLITVFIVSSCNCMKNTSEKNESQDYTILAEGDIGGKENRSLEVIQNQQQLDAVFAGLNKHTSQSHTKDVDFTKHTVVALYAGQKNTGGHSISVAKVEKRDNTVYVTVEESGPKPGEMATMVITTPYSIVLIDKAAKVVFK